MEVEKKVHPTTHLMRIAHLKELGKIPKGFTAADYIRYRKCKFIQEIDAVRQYLQVIYFILSLIVQIFFSYFFGVVDILKFTAQG